MSRLVQTQLAPASQLQAQSTRLSFAQIVILASLVLWLYGPILVRLFMQWSTDPDFSHGFLVPLFSGFLVWRDRARFAQLVPRPSWTGLGLIAFSLFTLIVGRLGAELFLARFSLLLLLAGMIVFFLGWNFFRAALFPWAFLVLMIPIPAIMFNQIAFPLQLLASRLASATLPLFDVPVFREGNVINLATKSLEVAKACSGIRSLLSLITVAIIYGVLTEKRLWVRTLLALASVPIAVMANGIRIIVIGLLVRYWTPDAADGYFHAYWGWVVFVLSLAMLYGLHALVRNLWRDGGTHE
ncbi:MAG TPA: exosortase [Candidatus Sulfotelmatobacter sp.]|nr:exosortase [Candidatus Sulfotelmatobacter sp.]